MPESVVLIVGRRIRELRQERGLFQEKLAEEAGLHRTYIGRIERGEENIGVEELLRIAAALGTSATAVLAVIADTAQDTGASDAQESVKGLVDEYRTLLGSRNRCEPELLEEALTSDADWTPLAAQHLVCLARNHGSFMLRNVTAIAVALGIEDGDLGF